MSMLPRRDWTRFRCVLRPSAAYRKSRAASRLQFFAVASAAIRGTIGSPFFQKKKKKEKERSREKHANGTAESGVFLLPSLRSRGKNVPRAIIAPSISRERIPIRWNCRNCSRISKLRNWYFEILSPKVANFKSLTTTDFHILSSSCNSEWWSPRSTQEQRHEAGGTRRWSLKFIPRRFN